MALMKKSHLYHSLQPRNLTNKLLPKVVTSVAESGEEAHTWTKTSWAMEITPVLNCTPLSGPPVSNYS